ncbi:cation transporter [Aeromicrobium sp.]|nr:cation transporter [Candidatus Saccharibacteria bacterium]
MSQKRRLIYLLFINVLMITGLVLVGLYSNSLSVLAAGGDFIADSLAIALGLFAIHRRDNHGDEKVTTYVALVNAGMLVLITFYVPIQAVGRLMTKSPEIHAQPVFIVAILSAVAMALGVYVLGKGAGNEDLHMRSVFLDTASDGISALGVALVGIVIAITHNYYWLDSVAAILISLIIGYGAIKLLFDVVKSIRTGQPMQTDDD